jgi:predicted dehydrogenase/sugar phosphate permease
VIGAMFCAMSPKPRPAEIQVAATSFLALFAIVGIALYGLPFFYDFMVRDFGWSRAQVTSGNALSKLLVGPLFGFLAGWMVDRFGPRRLLVAGILMAGAALFGLGAIHTLTGFYVFYLFNALGYVCGGPLPNQVLLSRWFTAARGRAMGFAYLGIGLGGALVPFLAVWLTRAVGWHGALQILGALIVVVALPLALVVSEAPGEVSTESMKTVKVGEGSEGSGGSVGPVFRAPAFYLLLIGSMCSIAAVGGTNQHLKLFLSLDQGFTQNAAAQIASLVLASSLVGRLGMGWLADRFPKKYVMLLIYLLVSLAIPLLLLTDVRGAIYPFALIFGLGLGGEYMVIPLMAGELFGLRVLGRTMGVVLTADGVAEAAAPWLVGRMHDATGSYATGFGALIACALVGAVAIACLPSGRRAVGPSGRKRLTVRPSDSPTVRLGVIMNGVTGRMGLNQHLARSIVAIRQQGGVALPDGTRLLPDPILVGRDESKLREIAHAHGISRVSTDLDACLADPTDEVYFDATLTSLRADHVRRAIAAGKHVYCEKPLAPTTTEALDLVQRVRRAGVKHGIVQDKLFLPGIRTLKRLVDAGFFGRIVSVRGEFGYWVFEGDDPAQPAQRPSWNYRQEDGGGIILDMFAHWRYVLDHTFGPVTAVQCVGATLIPERVDERGRRYAATADDAAYATFRLAGGSGEIIAQFNSSWAVRVYRDDLLQIQVDGTSGSAVAGLRGCKTQSRAETPRPVWNPDVPSPFDFYESWHDVPDAGDGDNAFKAQWELFLRYVAGHEPFPHDFLEGAKGVQLAELALQSWRERRWVDVPPLETRVPDVVHHPAAAR